MPRPPVSRDGDVPRLPRGRGVKLMGPQLFKIGMVAMLLVAVIMLRRPCSDAVGKFVSDFDQRDAGVKAPPPQQPDPYKSPVIEIDTRKMSDEEIKRRLDVFRNPDAGVP